MPLLPNYRQEKLERRWASVFKRANITAWANGPSKIALVFAGAVAGASRIHSGANGKQGVGERCAAIILKQTKQRRYAEQVADGEAGERATSRILNQVVT